MCVCVCVCVCVCHKLNLGEVLLGVRHLVAVWHNWQLRPLPSLNSTKLYNLCIKHGWSPGREVCGKMYLLYLFIYFSPLEVAVAGLSADVTVIHNI